LKSSRSLAHPDQAPHGQAGKQSQTAPDAEGGRAHHRFTDSL